MPLAPRVPCPCRVAGALLHSCGRSCRCTMPLLGHRGVVAQLRLHHTPQVPRTLRHRRVSGPVRLHVLRTLLRECTELGKSWCDHGCMGMAPCRRHHAVVIFHAPACMHIVVSRPCMHYRWLSLFTLLLYGRVSLPCWCPAALPCHCDYLYLASRLGIWSCAVGSSSVQARQGVRSQAPWLHGAFAAAVLPPPLRAQLLRALRRGLRRAFHSGNRSGNHRRLLQALPRGDRHQMRGQNVVASLRSGAV